MELKGFDFLVEFCRNHQLELDLAPPALTPVDTQMVFQTDPDPQLAAMLRKNNGGLLWRLHLYGGPGASNDLVERNRSLREIRDDIPFLTDMILFGEAAYQAVFWATIPALARPDGIQPVVYLDFNEVPKILPIASSIDRAFYLLGQYLEILKSRFGSINVGAGEYFFPWDIPDLVAKDQDLTQLLNSGKLDVYTKTDPEAAEWVKKIKNANAVMDNSPE